MNLQVEHIKNKHRFQSEIEDQKAYLSYKKQDSNTMECYETFVPKERRGQGVAAQLAKEALSYAKSNDLTVKSTCSYVKSYIDKHEEFQDIATDR